MKVNNSGSDKENKETAKIAKLKKRVLRLLLRGGNLCDWTKIRVDKSGNVLNNLNDLNSLYTENILNLEDFEDFKDLEDLKISFDILGRALFNKKE